MAFLQLASYLRLLASPIGHPSQVCLRICIFKLALTCDSIWPGLKYTSYLESAKIFNLLRSTGLH